MAKNSHALRIATVTSATPAARPLMAAPSFDREVEYIWTPHTLNRPLNCIRRCSVPGRYMQQQVGELRRYEVLYRDLRPRLARRWGISFNLSGVKRSEGWRSKPGIARRPVVALAAMRAQHRAWQMDETGEVKTIGQDACRCGPTGSRAVDHHSLHGVSVAKFASCLCPEHCIEALQYVRCPVSEPGNGCGAESDEN